jgi:transposase-like protein
MTHPSPFKWFKTSPEIIRLVVMMDVRFPLSLGAVEDLLHERGIDISHETVRSGGSALARSSRLRSASAGSRACSPATGGGILTRCS